jgi:2'-5' RNA ligase
MKSNHSEIPAWGSLTLVSYIPDPLGAFLHGLRRFLPGNHHAQPHVTILPPRPLRSAKETASREAQTILRQFPSFDVELSQVKCFPQTNVMYLDVAQGDSHLHRLHRVLNTGGLAHAERFEFLPHLTLGGPVPACSLSIFRDQAEAAWRSSNCSPRFSILEVVCLWLSPTAGWGNWQRLWSQSLALGRPALEKAASAAVTRTY